MGTSSNESHEKLNCIYCNTEKFSPQKGSVEHAILSSIGGKKTSRNICCIGCNQRLGNEVDEPLAKGIDILACLYGIKTGRGREAATLKGLKNKDGALINLLPKGKMEFVKKVDIKRTPDEENGVINLNIKASTEEDVIRRLNQQLKSVGKDISEFSFNSFTKETIYPGAINGNIDIGLHTQFRSIAKMALTYLATMISPDRLRSGAFSTIIDCISGTIDIDKKVLMTSSNFPTTPSISTPQHRIIISASKANRIIVGLVELYSGIKFKVILSDSWDGPDLQKGYAVNPINGTHTESDMIVNLGDEFWRASEVSQLDCTSVLNETLKKAFAHQSKSSFNDMIDTELLAFAEENIGKDFTEELKLELFQRVSDRIKASLLKKNNIINIDPELYL